MYSAYRPAEAGEYYHRFAHFMFPCFALTPDGTFKDHVQATLNVPMDDTHTMTINVSWKKRKLGLRTLKSGEAIPGAAKILAAVSSSFDEAAAASNADSTRSSVDGGRFTGWVNYPSAIRADDGFKKLRAALNLALLWRDQGKRTEARDLLAPVYNWFTEGFDTPVLQEAKALLEQLSA